MAACGGSARGRTRTHAQITAETHRARSRTAHCRRGRCAVRSHARAHRLFFSSTPQPPNFGVRSAFMLLAHRFLSITYHRHHPPSRFQLPLVYPCSFYLSLGRRACVQGRGAADARRRRPWRRPNFCRLLALSSPPSPQTNPAHPPALPPPPLLLAGWHCR